MDDNKNNNSKYGSYFYTSGDNLKKINNVNTSNVSNTVNKSNHSNPRMIRQGRPNTNPVNYAGRGIPKVNRSSYKPLPSPKIDSKENDENNINEEESNEQYREPRRRAVSDITGKVKKAKETISFFKKYKILIIGGCIAFVVIILFMFMMMVVELQGDLDDSYDELSNPSTSYLSNVYSECKSVNVNGKLYSLEDYVAGVVTHEAYTSMSMEALKAQAIAARTYAIVRSDYCKNNIGNSTSTQTFAENADARAKQAANDTAGIILTYDGDAFASEYDSYCIQDGECPDSKCVGDTCSVTYTKLPKYEKHKITISSKWKSSFLPGQGHARGMSQLVSYEMAENGSNYEEILKFFYSPGVELSYLSNRNSGINTGTKLLPFTIRKKTPVKSDWAWSGEYYGSNVGQCIWYAKGRMLEIISESVVDSNNKKKSMDIINSTYGNACAWYNQSLLNTFGGSDDVYDYKTGSLMVWKYAGSECNDSKTNNYGHVAIIENISDDGKVTITEGYSSNGNSCPETWDCVRFLSREFVSVDDFVNWLNNYSTSDGTKYDFLGYIHLLG